VQHRKNYRDEDYTGRRFGRLLAVEKVTGTRTVWLFRCDCGNTIQLRISRVIHGQKSCGCLRKETAAKWVESHTTHGESNTTLYHKYRSILDRCYNQKTWKYKRYGGRGIYVCDEWKNSFESFRDWAYKTGYDPTLDCRTEQSLDRIDNNGPYSPDNCRWATAREQQKNRECTTLYPYKGQYYSASEFADKFGISDKSFVYRRIKTKKQSLEYILRDWKLIHNVPQHLIEVADYAKARGCTDSHVKRLLGEGKLLGEKIGRKWYVDKQELNNLS
jgi:predicted DNA-binding protein YlxM (UPF0122 family)